MIIINEESENMYETIGTFNKCHTKSQQNRQRNISEKKSHPPNKYKNKSKGKAEHHPREKRKKKLEKKSQHQKQKIKHV